MSLINVSNLTFGYDGALDNVFENVSFQIDTDWRLGFVGRNGRGKTNFFKLLMNEFEHSGKISLKVNFEYYPYTVENTDWLMIELVREIAPSAMDWEIAKELSLLDLTDDALYRPFCTLSKGEQSKALLAALFLKENAFLPIDEPTNHLDIEAREKLAGYLKKKKGFTLISHGRYILDECTEYILAINKCNIEVMKGNFSDWQANKTLRDEYELKENEKLKGEIKRLSSSAMQTGGWSDKIEKSKTGTRVDFSKEQLEKNIEDFSEGQKKKVLLAESLCTPAHLYVWDEPLNYIDVISRIQLENLLKKFSPTVILVEHDKTFSDSIATKIIEI